MQTTILIVEGDELVRGSLREWLKSAFLAFRIVTAATDEEAIAVARDLLPSIVIIDAGLPVLAGLEATQRIKTLLPQAQVVVLSVHEAPIYRARATAAGASAYVTKSKMHTELLPVLMSLLPGQEKVNAVATHYE